LTLELRFPPEAVPLDGPIPLFRRRLRRVSGRALARLCNSVSETSLGRWLHRRLLASLEPESVEIELPGAPSGAEWPSIAFLSDLHAGHYMTGADLEVLAARVMAAAPDLVCLGGDLINHFEEELAFLVPLLQGLRPPLGVVAVPGNHDYVEPGELDGWRTLLERHGVRVLVNHGMRLEHRGGSFWIGGVDDLTEGEPRLSEALAGRRAGEPTLLLSHHPDLFREASAHGVDLQLSGHTHAGQIKILGWAPVHHSRFGWVEGFYARGTSRLFVGGGAGVTALPLRIGTRSVLPILRPRGLRQGG